LISWKRLRFAEDFAPRTEVHRGRSTAAGGRARPLQMVKSYFGLWQKRR
jgi:hypothetical protein